MKQFERECITLVKSKLFNPHRNKRVRENTPLPLVHISGKEIFDILDAMPWEVLDNSDVGAYDIGNWIERCRKNQKKWLKKEFPICHLGWLWAGDSTGRSKVSYWLEYNIGISDMYYS